VPPVHHVVGNTVNTRDDRWHDRHADNRLVYYPTMVTSTRQGSVPFAPLQVVATCELLLLYSLCVARLVPRIVDTRMFCGVCKYYVGQKP